MKHTQRRQGRSKHNGHHHKKVTKKCLGVGLWGNNYFRFDVAKKVACLNEVAKETPPLIPVRCRRNRRAALLQGQCPARAG
jgi:hypothetical protein